MKPENYQRDFSHCITVSILDSRKNEIIIAANNLAKYMIYPLVFLLIGIVIYNI
jgi:hypothetical protein